MNQGLIKLSKQVFNFRFTRFITTTSCDEFCTTSDFCVKNILEQDKKKNDWIRLEGDPADMSKVLKDYKDFKKKKKEEDPDYYKNIYENYGNTDRYPTEN